MLNVTYYLTSLCLTSHYACQKFICTFSLLVSCKFLLSLFPQLSSMIILIPAVNSRHTDNDHGTSERGSSSRGDRDVELTVLHTSSIPSTQVSVHTQLVLGRQVLTTLNFPSFRRETTGDLEEQTQGPMIYRCCVVATMKYIHNDSL